jgi:hypothetical protein
VARRAAVASGIATADQLIPNADVHDRGVSANDRGERAFLRTIARLDGLRATPSSWFTETAARLGLHPTQDHAVKKAALVLSADPDALAGQRVAQLDDPWSRAARNRTAPGLPTAVPSRATYQQKAFSSTGAALLATAVFSLFRGEPTTAVVSLALAAAVPYTAGTGEWVTRVRSRRTADAKEAEARAAEAAASQDLVTGEQRLLNQLTDLAAEVARLGGPGLVMPSIDVVVPGNRLDPAANPLPYRRPRSAVLATRSYLRKTATAPLVYGALVGFVVFRTRLLTPFQPAATLLIGGLSGSIGEWLKYRAQEREQDRDADRQYDRDFETRQLDLAASQLRRDQQRQQAAALRAWLAQVAVGSRLTLPADLIQGTAQPDANATPAPGPSRVVSNDLLDADHLAPYSLRNELPSLTKHLVKSGFSTVGLGTAMRAAVAVGLSALTGTPLPMVVLWAGVAGGAIGTVVGGVSESRMQYHWDRLRRERERDEGELDAQSSAEISAHNAAVLDDLHAAGRILAAFGTAWEVPELRAALPEPTDVPAPPVITPPASGPANRNRLWDRSYLLRTVPAAIVYFAVGVPLSLLLGTERSLPPGLSSRIATVVYAFGDKWADGAEKDRASARKAPHRARMAQAAERQKAQRADAEELAAELAGRVEALRRADQARNAGPATLPSPPNPGTPPTSP